MTVDSSNPQMQPRPGPWKRCLAWCYGHPVLGWWIALLSVINVILNLLNLF